MAKPALAVLTGELKAKLFSGSSSGVSGVGVSICDIPPNTKAIPMFPAVAAKLNDAPVVYPNPKPTPPAPKPAPGANIAAPMKTAPNKI